MQKLLLILLCLPMVVLAQQTYVPDDNFEAYLEANGMGNGVPNDDYVTTANINTVTSLNVINENIADLTGIENFTDLTTLACDSNQLNSFDISNNTALTNLQCYSNQLTTLDVSVCTALTSLQCSYQQINSLDVSNNTALTHLMCSVNSITSLDVSNNTALILLNCNTNSLSNLDVSNNTALQYLYCYYNQLTTLNLTNNTSLTSFRCENNNLISLDIRNGNNINMISAPLIPKFTNNPQLYCIDVDDANYSTANWTVANGNIDPQHYFSDNCSGTTSINEHTTSKKLLKVIDLLGKKTKPQTNIPLIEIYDDGTVEKRITID